MRIKSLTIYPLKSGRGYSLSEALVTPQGIQGDRRWVLVDEKGKFVSQRSLPKLALLELKLGRDLSLTLSWAGRSLSLAKPMGDLRSIEVWKDKILAHDWGQEAHEFLSGIAGQELWLCEAQDAHPRWVNHDSLGEQRVPYYFADGFPFLLIAQESLDLLNQKLDEKSLARVPMDRFRPNIVIEGWRAHAEDEYQQIRLGRELVLQLTKPCTRCIMTTVDQTLGVAGQEPLRTLAEYRRGPEGGIYFGQNAYLLEGAGTTLRIGDSVEVLS